MMGDTNRDGGQELFLHRQEKGPRWTGTTNRYKSALELQVKSWSFKQAILGDNSRVAIGMRRYHRFYPAPLQQTALYTKSRQHHSTIFHVRE